MGTRNNLRLAALVTRRLPAALVRHAAATSAARKAKPLGELTIDDLVACPIWEEVSRAKFVEVNEGMYRPRQDLERYDAAIGSGVFVVITRFKLADGSECFGYSSPAPEIAHRLGYMTPAIITERGRVPFWFNFDEEPAADFARPFYEKLGRNGRDEVFPIEFEALVPSNTSGTGVIEAFQGLLYRNREFVEISRT